MKKIKIVTATKEDESKFSDLLITKFLNKTNISFNIFFNNRKSLAQVYNSYIENQFKDRIVVFCHDDLIIEDIFLEEKLNEAMESYDIIGLAGIQAPITIKSPALWHLMGPQTQYSGAVAHFEKNSNNSRFVTSFGITPKRCILLDGVFLAVNMEKILEKGLLFDENNPAKFHFYDLIFSLQANKLGLKLGTWPIWATHRSHGLEQPSQDWINAEKYFLQKYT